MSIHTKLCYSGPRDLKNPIEAVFSPRLGHCLSDHTSTSKEVQDRFGCSAGTVSNWIKAGCPHTKTPRATGGKPRTFFNLDEMALWVKQKRLNLSATGGGDTRSAAFRAGADTNSQDGRRKRIESIDVAREEAKLRKELAAAETAELNLEKMKAQLHSTDECKLQTMAKIARARAVLLGGPAVLSQDTVGDPEQDEALMAEWVHRALTELSTEEDDV